jgi:glycyl-tRNA synthetase beta chain
VAAVAADKAVSVKLMPVAVGLTPAGEPTPALLKKLAALGADAGAVAQLQRRVDGKAEALFLDTVVPGATLAAGLQLALDEAIAKLPIPKVMQYQLETDGWTDVKFVRPAHGLVALHGADLVPVSALGLTSRRETRGHRFEAPMDPVVLQDADHYERQLHEQGAVIASFGARRAEIQRQLAGAAAAEGLMPIDDEALLDEVTALVERPRVFVCSFEEAFLAVPPECLILTMKANQKYFPLLDEGGEGRLTNRFLIVSNISPADADGGGPAATSAWCARAWPMPSSSSTRTANAHWPRASEGLAKVVYHGKLGTQGERIDRVRRIARAIGEQLGGDVALADLADDRRDGWPRPTC